MLHSPNMMLCNFGVKSKLNTYRVTALSLEDIQDEKYKIKKAFNSISLLVPAIIRSYI